MSFFEQTLKVDRIMSVEQAQRHYQIDPFEFRNILCVQHFLSTTNYSQSHNKYTFITFEPKLVHFRGFRLRHLAGITEMRHLLDAPIEQWKNRADRENALSIPDAIWKKGYVEIPIEYDTGSYSLKQLKTKLFDFDVKYRNQIWGTPSKKRQEKLQALMEQGQYIGQVLKAEWW
jgi:hypothetical protein